jgi:hypothetical protein
MVDWDEALKRALGFAARRVGVAGNALEQIMVPGKKVYDHTATQGALDAFIQNFYTGEGLSNVQAEENLKNGLVEIVFRGALLPEILGLPPLPGFHISNGLLITEDGYFITAHHCLEGFEKYSLPHLGDMKIPISSGLMGVRDTSGRTYTIERAWGFPDYDFILAKARIPRRPSKSIPYRFCDTRVEQLKRGISIGVWSRWNGRLKERYGFIDQPYVASITTRDGVSYKDHFSMELVDIIPGDSGGIVKTADHRVVGLISTGDDQLNGSAVRLTKALEFIQKCRQEYFCV